ncbi:mitochondrial Rho GTPase 1 isoform X2 [Folsomia candida]|uniref:mitochondrial Rho GTPase 1 isoform X2 n=1 Tax=Folsomia candida TaxID=158441 RepID=UPI000B8F5E3B|nr:mitochondrial Rho GTPase 1 isoform X2 [Folsomia candida]
MLVTTPMMPSTREYRQAEDLYFRSHCRRDVRILLVGEPGVGKTSVILSLVSEEFADSVPPRSEEITIPADVTPELVPTNIVDYSTQEQGETELGEELLRAHVICVVYDVNNEETIDRISTYWLPIIRSTLGEDHKVPVILVGNKIDLVDYTTMEMVVPLMNEFAEIETCIECSAKTLRNISELFYYAQKAVLHPTSPLYNSDKKELTDKCKKALERIFRICDVNNDGLMDDLEMYAFQKFCYDAPLQPQALDSVKAIIQRNCEDGVFVNGITLSGFIVLHRLFIQRGKHETTWTALRKYGYNDELNVCNDYLCPVLSIPLGTTTELNQIGFDFFTSMFVKHDKDRDRALCPEELMSLFATCPNIPWGKQLFQAVQTTEKGWLTYSGFICQWVLTTLLDVNKTMEYMAYLGYPITEERNQTEAISVTREKRLDLAKKQSTRNVYRCHVIGAKNSGKTTLCQGLIGRTLEQTKRFANDGQELPNFVVNMVQVYGQEKYLCMQDIDLNRVVDFLPTNEVLCDVACLVFDSSDPKSFEFVARTYLNYYATQKIPVLIVGNKSDCGDVMQDYILQPTAFCAKYKLPPPHSFSCLEKVNKEIYVKLATMAAFPHLRRLGVIPDGSVPWVKTGVGVALVTTMAYLVYKMLNPQNNPLRGRTTN